MIVVVTGSLKDLNGGDVTKRAEITVQLSVGSVEYDDNVESYLVMGVIQTIYPDSSGDWEVSLVDTDNMEANTYYTFYINGREYNKLVSSDSAAVEFKDLTDYVN